LAVNIIFELFSVLMEMLIVSRFSYPPVTLIDEDARNQMVGKEMQMALVSMLELCSVFVSLLIIFYQLNFTL